MTNTAQEDPAELNGLILGAENIALFLFKRFINAAPESEREAVLKRYRRKVYHLRSLRRLPVFELGAQLAARESTLIEYIEKLEKKSASNTPGWDEENQNEKDGTERKDN